MKSDPTAKRELPLPVGELADLLSQRTVIERFLADTPAEDVLDRASLSARLDVIQGRIDELSEATGLQR